MDNRKKPIKTISLFSGIGAYEKAAKNLGIDLEVLHFCEINKFAATAYSAIHDIPEEKNLGDITLVDTKKLPKCDLVTYSFPCFVAGTLVLTENGYKKIEDIKIGDKVLTHTNEYKEVLLPMEKYSNRILKLKTNYSEDIFVTEEHPFYARKKNKKSENVYFEKPTWIKARDLSSDDYLGMAINQKSQLPIFEGEISKLFKFEEFWWIIGRFISNGWSRDNNSITIYCYEKEIELIKEKLNKLSLNYDLVSKKTYNKFHIFFDDISSFVDQFEKQSFRKELTSTIFDLPKKELKEFINGFIEFDLYEQEENFTISILNKELACSMQQCIMKAYEIPCYISKVDNEIRIEQYSIQFKKDIDEKENAFFEENHIWFPFNEISEEIYDGMVYNMEVEEDNSYTVNNIIVHNCQSISCAGRREGIIKGETKSGLVYEALDIIEATSPKIAIMENVKNLVGKKFINDFNNLLQILDDLGYNNYWQVLNAKDYGLPQNRTRVFLVSIRKDIDMGYKFPEPVELKLKAIDLINKDDENVYWVNENSDAKVYSYLVQKGFNDIEGVAKNPRTREYHNFKEISDCLLAHDGQTKNLVQFFDKDGNRLFRRMTPAESFKFMGFEEEDYYKAKKRLEEVHYNGKPRSDSQTYRMAGNSIAVNCIQAILENLYINQI